MIDNQVCNFCIMDTTDKDIQFDDDGRCNHCKDYFIKRDAQLIKKSEQKSELDKIIKNVKNSNLKGQYDCVIGISGGVDSSYVALLAKDHGLRALLVHLDNGWNSEISIKNVNNITKETGFHLYTHVIDWNEFKDLQLSLFKASVVDIELVTDHAIKAVLLKTAAKFNIKYILNGGNVVTEAIMPISWRHTKVDKSNILDIHKKFGNIKIKTYPMAGILKQQYYKYVLKIKTIQILNYVDFNRGDTVERLKKELKWHEYGGKHHESVFTRFYQGYILPSKFNIDKRLAHYSNLICANQLSRKEAISKISEPVYNEDLLNQDHEFVLKKLDFTKEEFENYISSSPRSHYEFKSDDSMIKNLLKIRNFIFGYNK